MFNGSFTLPDTETETDNICTEPKWKFASVSVSEQYEHLHTILYNPFVICLCLGDCSVNTPEWITYTA